MRFLKNPNVPLLYIQEVLGASQFLCCCCCCFVSFVWLFFVIKNGCLVSNVAEYEIHFKFPSYTVSSLIKRGCKLREAHFRKVVLYCIALRCVVVYCICFHSIYDCIYNIKVSIMKIYCKAILCKEGVCLERCLPCNSNN